MKANLLLDIELVVPDGTTQEDLQDLARKVEEKIIALDDVTSTDVMDLLY